MIGKPANSDYWCPGCITPLTSTLVACRYVCDACGKAWDIRLLTITEAQQSAEPAPELLNRFRAVDAIEFTHARDWALENGPEATQRRLEAIKNRIAKVRSVEKPSDMLAAQRGYEAALGPMEIVVLEER